MIATVALMRHGGSHLIRPIVFRLGANIIEPGNFHAPLEKAEGPVIVFVRDPRDRMVALRRWWVALDGETGKPNKPRKAARLAEVGDREDEQLAWLLRDGALKGPGGFIGEMLLWARIWCRWPDAMTVRFEIMRERGTDEIARIAGHLGLCQDYQRDAAIYAEVFEKGRTFTGRYSDWRESFGPQANAVWAENGGPELLELMGYA